MVAMIETLKVDLMMSQVVRVMNKVVMSVVSKMVTLVSLVNRKVMKLVMEKAVVLISCCNLIRSLRKAGPNVLQETLFVKKVAIMVVIIVADLVVLRA
jgi:hypothetical protein